MEVEDSGIQRYQLRWLEGSNFYSSRRIDFSSPKSSTVNDPGSKCQVPSPSIYPKALAGMVIVLSMKLLGGTRT